MFKADPCPNAAILLHEAAIECDGSLLLGPAGFQLCWFGIRAGFYDRCNGVLNQQSDVLAAKRSSFIGGSCHCRTSQVGVHGFCVVGGCVRMRGRHNDIGSRNSGLLRRQSFHFDGKICRSRNQVTNHQRRLLRLTAKDDALCLQRIDFTFCQPLMKISGHRKSNGRRNIGLR